MAAKKKAKKKKKSIKVKKDRNSPNLGTGRRNPDA